MPRPGFSDISVILGGGTPRTQGPAAQLVQQLHAELLGCKLLASAWFLLDTQHRDCEGVRVPGEEMAAPAGRRSCLWLRLACTRS